MPELPEVQTTVSGLKKNISGLKINDIWSDWPKSIKSHKNLASFKADAKNRKIADVNRRGKNILIFLSGGTTMLIHQKMTGHLMVGKWLLGKRAIPVSPPAIKEKINGYVHFVIVFTNGKMLGLSDVRKFSKILLMKSEEMLRLPEIKKLGPDALDKTLTVKKFKEALLKKNNGKIKQVLMDQEIIAGVGNIYSDEILWEAGIHPLERVSELNDKDIKKIYIEMRKILARSIDLGGDSMSDYRNVYGQSGKFQLKHKVYGRAGQNCYVCHGKISRIKIGGRSAHFCPKCQKPK